MTARNYALLAATIFAIVAIMALARAVLGWPMTVGGVSIPFWTSWVTCPVAALLSWLGFRAAVI